MSHSYIVQRCCATTLLNRFAGFLSGILSIQEDCSRLRGGFSAQMKRCRDMPIRGLYSLLRLVRVNVVAVFKSF